MEAHMPMVDEDVFGNRPVARKPGAETGEP